MSKFLGYSSLAGRKITDIAFIRWEGLGSDPKLVAEAKAMFGADVYKYLRKTSAAYAAGIVEFMRNRVSTPAFNCDVVFNNGQVFATVEVSPFGRELLNQIWAGIWAFKILPVPPVGPGSGDSYYVGTGARLDGVSLQSMFYAGTLKELGIYLLTGFYESDETIILDMEMWVAVRGKVVPRISMRPFMVPPYGYPVFPYPYDLLSIPAYHREPLKNVILPVVDAIVDAMRDGAVIGGGMLVPHALYDEGPERNTTLSFYPTGPSVTQIL